MRVAYVQDLPGWVLPMLALPLLVVAWEGLVRIFDIPLFVMPAPSEVLRASWAGRSQLPFHTFITLYETLAGFAAGAVVGIGLGIVLVSSRILRDTFFPMLVVAQSVPKVAVAPLLVIAIGYGELPKIITVFLVCFFPIVVSTSAGLEAAPRDLCDLARAMSASRFDTFRKIRFPVAVPHIFVGLKVAMTLAVIGAVIGEFVGSDRGLGYLILISTSQANTGLAFGAIAVLAVMSIALFYTVEIVERRVVFWGRD
jgi:NitT/TauT family transport system permease protein